MNPKTASALLALVLSFGLSGCTGKDEAPVANSPTASAEPDSSAEAPSTPPVLSDGPGDATLTFSGGEKELGQGSFDRSDLTIAVGQTVEFVAGDGGTYAVKVGGLDGVTISGGLKEYYRFDAAGTYPVVEDISGATASIVVK